MTPSHRVLLAASVAIAGSASAVSLASAAAPAASSRRTPRACATHIPLARIPRDVAIFRGGHRLRNPSRRKVPSPPRRPSGTTGPTGPTVPTGPVRPSPKPAKPFLQVGDEVFVSRPGFKISYAGNRFRISHAQFRLRCLRLEVNSRPHGPRTIALALALHSGRVQVSSGPRAARALVLTPEMLAFASERGTRFVVDRNPHSRSTHAWTLNKLIVAAKASDQALRIDTRITYTAISDSRGLRLDIWPFAISPLQRPTTPGDDLPAFWADGQPCSVGCTASGAIAGWPLRPFHQQHAIRAGINELRPANFHVAVDIQARNGQPVYAIQSGYASIRYPGTGDVNVDVGRFYYWHIIPTVSDGQYVVAYKTVIGDVIYGFTHVALSEGTTSDYLNPLRPGGSLQPYHDSRAADHRGAADLQRRAGDRRGVRAAELRRDRLLVRDARCSRPRRWRGGSTTPAAGR